MYVTGAPAPPSGRCARGEALMHAKPSIASFTNDAMRGVARKDVRSVWWRHAGDASAEVLFASAYTPLSAMVRNRGSASLNWYMLCRESPSTSICADPAPFSFPHHAAP